MRKNKQSRTAYKVALNIVTLGVVPEMEPILPPGIVPATEKLLIASGATRAKTVQWARSKRMVSVYEAFDWMLPGQFRAFAHRKAFCENQVKMGIDAGATQILVLGAGYDTLGWRLAPAFPGVRFYEIDHPNTSRLKVKGIEAMGRHDNLYLIAEDLGQRNLVDVLATMASWDPGAPTVIVAEGLLMYLPPDAVRDLFRQCAVITGIGSRIAFSYIPSGNDGRPDAGRWTGIMLWLQKAAGEPWLWSTRPESLGPFLEETGWTIPPAPSEAIVKHGVEFFVAAARQ